MDTAGSPGIYPNGTVFCDRFEIVSFLAAGGMAQVYVAKQLIVEREVALKVLSPEFSVNEGVVARFFREAKVIGGLMHPNTVHLYDMGETPDHRLFLVMELLKGTELGDYLQARGPMTPQEMFPIVKQVAGSLSEAHQKGIIHRDLKPGNIFLTDLNVVKVLDFGIAKIKDDSSSAEERKLTKIGTAPGTPEYMSPEQARGSELDARSDLYSLGIVMYEMLCGHPPFEESTFLGTILKQVQSPPPPLPDVIPAPLRNYIINRMLAKDPNCRPNDTEMFIREIDELSSRICPDGNRKEIAEDNAQLSQAKAEIEALRSKLAQTKMELLRSEENAILTEQELRAAQQSNTRIGNPQNGISLSVPNLSPASAPSMVPQPMPVPMMPSAQPNHPANLPLAGGQPGMAPMNPRMTQPGMAQPGMTPMNPRMTQPGMAPMNPRMTQPGMAQPGMTPMNPRMTQPGMTPMNPRMAQPGMTPMNPRMAQPGMTPIQPVPLGTGVNAYPPTQGASQPKPSPAQPMPAVSRSPGMPYGYQTGTNIPQNSQRPNCQGNAPSDSYEAAAPKTLPSAPTSLPVNLNANALNANAANLNPNNPAMPQSMSRRQIPPGTVVSIQTNRQTNIQDSSQMRINSASAPSHARESRLAPQPPSNTANRRVQRGVMYGQPSHAANAYSEEEAIIPPTPRHTASAIDTSSIMSKNHIMQTPSSHPNKGGYADAVGNTELNLEKASQVPRDSLTGLPAVSASSSKSASAAAGGNPQNTLMMFAQPIIATMGQDKVVEALHLAQGVWNAAALGGTAVKELYASVAGTVSLEKIVHALLLRKEKYFADEKWQIDDLQVNKKANGDLTIHFNQI